MVRHTGGRCVRAPRKIVAQAARKAGVLGKRLGCWLKMDATGMLLEC